MRERIEAVKRKLDTLVNDLPNQSHLFEGADDRDYRKPGPVQDINGFNANVACFMQPNPVRAVTYVKVQDVCTAYLSFFKDVQRMIAACGAGLIESESKPRIAFDLLWNTLFEVSKERLNVTARSFGAVSQLILFQSLRSSYLGACRSG